MNRVPIPFRLLIPVVVVGLVQARPANAQPSLVAHWRFDEGSGLVASDDSGNGNSGSLFGPQWSLDTPDGSAFALQFDGVDDFVDLGGLDVFGEPLTIAMWFKADSFGGTSRDNRLISKAVGTASNDHFWMVSTIASGTSTRLRFRLRTNGATATLIASSGDLSTDVWTHVAAVYDGAMMRLYKDGVEVGNTPKSGLLDTNPTVGAAIGNQPAGAGAKSFAGVLDDVRMYEQALSPVEIQMLAENRPVALDDTYAVARDVALVVNSAGGVLSNDSDPQNDPLSAVLVTTPVSGSVVLNADGSFTYTPTLAFIGLDSMTYQASDGGTLSNLATVLLSVTDPGAPVAFADSYVVSQERGIGCRCGRRRARQ